ncbi:hypothetical protein EC973_003631 [Apophysomyces ossiformis]|uniref:Uncharacterized protein n=1 Tax=Apophysomyces ossiformis TaxID=679940 RepID=A0A8H7BT23_9FUNG|nr:hypothetical protein EC973_003631 [Apophysomyces ossiformis]
MPTTDYFTQHYLTATMIVWASTFSMLVLFIPKLHRFFFKKASNHNSGKASDLSGRKRSHSLHELSNHSRKENQPQQQSHEELMSLGQMVSTGNPLGRTGNGNQNQNNPVGTSQGVLLEAHEVLSFYLSISFPFISPKPVGANPLHGLGRSDVLIQVGSQQELQQWYTRFNRSMGGASQENCSSDQTFLTSESSEAAILTDSDKMDSGLTSRHLLSGIGRQSVISTGTMDSCLNAPAVNELSSHGRSATLSSTASSTNPFVHPPLPSQPPPVSLFHRRRSARAMESNGRSSFYSAFAGYLSASETSTPPTIDASHHTMTTDDIMMENGHTKA